MQLRIRFDNSRQFVYVTIISVCELYSKEFDLKVFIMSVIICFAYAIA